MYLRDGKPMSYPEEGAAFFQPLSLVPPRTMGIDLNLLRGGYAGMGQFFEHGFSPEEEQASATTSAVPAVPATPSSSTDTSSSAPAMDITAPDGSTSSTITDASASYVAPAPSDSTTAPSPDVEQEA